MDRRTFLETAVKIGSAAAFAGCGRNPSGSPDYGVGRLTTRPGTPTASAAPGLATLGTGSRPDGYLYVPTGYVATTPLPLVLTLHGAGGSAAGPLDISRAAMVWTTT